MKNENEKYVVENEKRKVKCGLIFANLLFIYEISQNDIRYLK